MAKYIVTTSALRIRSGPGTTYSIIGMLYKNNTVQGNELNGDWVHITTAENLTGWSHRAYLELVDETTPPPASETTYRVDASTLNLRQGPGLTYAVIGSLKQELIGRNTSRGRFGRLVAATRGQRGHRDDGQQNAPAGARTGTRGNHARRSASPIVDTPV